MGNGKQKYLVLRGTFYVQFTDYLLKFGGPPAQFYFFSLHSPFLLPHGHATRSNCKIQKQIMKFHNDNQLNNLLFIELFSYIS